MAKPVGARIQIDSGSRPKAAAPEAVDAGGDVVMDQFAREFTAVMQLTREKQAKELTSESFGGSREDVVNARHEVAFYGDIAQKLTPLVDRLMQATADQISSTQKTELLLAFGDKFYHAQEFRAASMFFYENVLLLDEQTHAGTTDNHQGVLDRVVASEASLTWQRNRLDGQAYVRSLYGAAMCCFHVQKRSDPFVRHPGRLEKMIRALTFLRLGMETAIALERNYSGHFSWLTLNGTVFIYSIAKPLLALGFSKEVITYLKWSLLAMESAVALSTTKYIMWRLQLGSAVCDCYEDLALKEPAMADHHIKSAGACAMHLQRSVQRLRKEEELDMPLPVEVQRTLAHAETTTNMLMARMTAAAAHQPLTRSAIETSFPTKQDQIRAAVDAIETVSHGFKQKRGGQGSFVLVSPLSPMNEALSELLDFIINIVSPLLNSLVEAEESTSTTGSPELGLDTFPLSFHITVIRHCFELAKPNDQLSLLISSAHVRLQHTPEGQTNTDPAMVSCLLELYETLHELKQSWISWEALSENKRLEMKPILRQHLPLSGETIPATKFLMRLSKAMQDCVFYGDGVISRTNSELMTTVALQMWREFVIPLLKELDNTGPSRLSKPLVRLTCELLLTVHFTFTAVKLEDLLLHGQVCLRLATVLTTRGKVRRGCQIVRQCLERINSRRSELVNLSSHFHSVADSAQLITALSTISFSCSAGERSSSPDITNQSSDARDCVGIHGTGSQLGGLHQDLCCVQVDLLLLLYRLELQAATMIDTLPLTGSKSSTTVPGNSFKSTSVLTAAETKLVEECYQNGYARVLLNIQRITHPHKSVKERALLADESIQLLHQMQDQEEQLRRQLIPPTQENMEALVPAPPIVISRSSSAVTVKVVEYHPSIPSLRKKRVLYYMVFAKPVGAGTAVSLNSNHLAGTATPVYPPHLTMTISGLLPNESYVFAVAAFDNNHEVINSIGETSEPVVALNPLPLPMCYGYLAKACYDVQLAGRANKAASYLYNAVVSHSCSGRPSWMANPFYRQALKCDTVAQFPIPILNLCIQALLILCHSEPGDLQQDGKLVTSFDMDAQSLTTAQTKALEDSRKISMAIEIACATNDVEAIRVLSFKGYRLLLPLLHLKGSCDGLTFAALVTFYQVTSALYGIKIKFMTHIVLCYNTGTSLNQHLNEPGQALSGDIGRNEDDNSLREVIALFKLASSSQASTSSPDSSNSAAPASAAVASPRGAEGKVPLAAHKDKSQSNTPQATPRGTGGDDKVEAEGQMQRLDELIQSAGNELGKVFVALERQCTADRRAIEFACKVCAAVLGSGTCEVTQMDNFLSSLKVAGTTSNQFRTTLSSIGGGTLLQEVKETATADEGNQFSARADQESNIGETSEIEDTIAGAVAEADEEYLYQWCGELFFIQSVLLYRKITKLCRTADAVDTRHGPDTEDCTYVLLHSDKNKEDDAPSESPRGGLATTKSDLVPTEDASADAQDSLTRQAGPNDTIKENNELDKLFGELLMKTAGCCKLFRLGNCWQSLQAAAQQLWNAIWHGWVAPSRISESPERIAHLSECVEALLDMIDTAVNGDRNQIETSPMTATPVTTVNTPSTAEPSMALSTVVHAVTNALSIGQTWFARLMAYLLRALCSAKDWKGIVEKGSRYFALCGSSTEGTRFSEQNFPILIYAQQQIVNQQETLLKAAEDELSSYVVAFQEQEAKKKKKKSRLVVEEVLSPEEVLFRANKQDMEQRIEVLITDRNMEREKLLDLAEIYDGLIKAINKSHQALNTCRELVVKYRRVNQRSPDAIINHSVQEDLPTLRHQIVASYNRCVILSRQKHQKRIVCQALHEVGDFHLACGDVKAATKSWLESLDNAFSTLNVCTSWRETLAPPADYFLECNGGSSNKDKVAGDELWVGLQCCGVLSKLILHSSGVNLRKATDYALMAAAIFTQFYGCSLPHPSKCFLFGSYRIIGQFWPGRLLLTDPDRVFPFSLGIMLVLVPEILLQYEHQYATTVMPIIAGYEHVAETCLGDVNHVANARRLRVEALVQCGRFGEAFQVIMNLLRGGTTPRSNSGAPQLDAVLFCDNRSILDMANRTAANWLITFNVEQTQADLKKHYHGALVGHILLGVLHFAVALARHEARYDRDTAIVRSAAKKMALAIHLVIKPNEAKNTPAQTSRNNISGEENENVLPDQQSLSWEDLQLHRIRADIHLQLSCLAFYEGEWNASKASSMDAIGEYDAIGVGVEQPLHLKLDQELKFSLIFSRGTFIAKCRSQLIACYLAQTHYRTAFEAAQSAIEEAKIISEEHLRQHLELQRLQASVFLGEREMADRELRNLRGNALAFHTSCSLTYVRTLQTLSSLLRSKALLSATALAEVQACLGEAARILDTILEHDGWVGVCYDHSPPMQAKRLHLYRPAIPDFVQVHADLAQILLECPLNFESEDVHKRKKRALESIETGLHALDHCTQPMAATKARLLLFKGVLLSKALHATATTPESESMSNEQKLLKRFEECVQALTGCIQSSIQGGYDRLLVRLALIELVDLFGRKLIPGSEDVHVQAAFHYLNLALEVQKHEAVVFDSLELQNGTVTSVEKLPPSVCAAINSQCDSIEDASIPPQVSMKSPDVAAIVNYFVRLLRMQYILPASTTPLQDMCTLLHTFLLQYHSAYSRIACMLDMPPVPSTDPEIRAGMVCALWGQDLAPAIAAGAGDSTHQGKLTFYFTLGTTKVSIAEDSPAAKNAIALCRMEKFASSPLLSKRCNLDRRAVNELKTALSRLRTQMEDEESLLVDRNTFPNALRLVLIEVQHLFRGSNGLGHPAEPTKADHQDITKHDLQVESITSESLVDAFGNTITIECTLEKIQLLDDLFSINKGVNVADNELCYFFRDLLD
ncbi:unnamed protein product [Phytophthora lilii]|uniref:Unnamed protein product n=1 Tax=Phytophthora lilii TaxID=2077276 RepID=A0A9W6THP0_9STRA|nr:unnamed protein product [Phytophthora lilii]